MKDRLYYLDVLRGVASLIVACLYHYVHFSSKIQPNSAGDIPPFYSISPLKFFFDRGDLMVDVFFVLSGIVFSYTYRQSIQDRRVTITDFFIKRFSRLYPIHILTLLIVTCIVYSFFFYFKTYPVYLNNDLYHFILNVLFLQRGFFDNGYSFNGPAWSLSIEMLMYVLFFIQARYFKVIHSSILFVLIGLVIFRFLPFHFHFLINVDVSRGLIGFFSGCLLYELFLKKTFFTYVKYIILPAFAFAYFIYMIWLSRYINIPLNVQVIAALFIIIPYLHHSEFIRKHSKINWLIILGDISLAVYLIHAPVQMIIIFYYRLSEKMIQYDSPVLLFIYSFFVILLGYLLHYYFEKPIQDRIRKTLQSYNLQALKKNI